MYPAMKSEDMTYFMGELASIHKDRGRFIAHSMSFVRERAVAEDIYSESIVKILEKKDIFVEGSNVRGYFHRVVMSKSYDYIKRESMLSSAHREIRDTALRDAMLGILAERDSNGMAFLSDLNERIAECRRKLPQKSFDIFIASRMDGLTYKEIAEEYQLTTRQVTTEIQRALAVFRSVFGDLLIVFVILS